jgi:poly-gamma-glutamate capsule biosynthesis protein CapA/YwtB (metallophosphatase superfamily)
MADRPDSGTPLSSSKRRSFLDAFAWLAPPLLLCLGALCIVVFRGTEEQRVEGAPAGNSTVSLLFAGDVMLGRGVARLATAGPDRLFADVRFQVRSADLAVANLESPLTSRPHDPAFGENALEASPASARLLVAAGFDAVGIANNHAGDAGPATVTDTMEALSKNGLSVIGAGSTIAKALEPRIVTIGGIRVALLAFDVSGQGPRAGIAQPGIASWDDDLARAAVTRARAGADVVAVGIHGGAEYVPVTDPSLMRIAKLLATSGADVVWGHGPHVVQPIRLIDPDRDGRPTIVATSLGNFVFDQHAPGTRRGAMLEVVAGTNGVRAYRIGSVEHEQGPVVFRRWRSPQTDAVAFGDGWWTLAQPVTPAPIKRPRSLAGFKGDVIDAALGDPDGDGRSDLVVAFRRPFAVSAFNSLYPKRRFADRRGRSAHVGLYRPRDLRPRWVAGTLLRPVVTLVPCHGALAIAYSTLDNPMVIGTGAWRWGGFGFQPLPDLPGSGIPRCADVNGDGRLDPVILERSSR